MRYNLLYSILDPFLLKAYLFMLRFAGAGHPLVVQIRFGGRRHLLKLLDTAKTGHISASSFRDLPILKLPYEKTGRPNLRMKTASAEIPFDDNAFSLAFTDNEDSMSVHRFHWLLTCLFENPDKTQITKSIGLIKKWIDLSESGRIKPANDPYSISERLLSWLYIFMFAKGEGLPDNDAAGMFAPSMDRQLSVLLDNLECHNKWTNNHILNNARALYILGISLDSPGIAELGRSILKTETDLMIPGGALRENSSHYQMLITRSFLEVYSFAEIMKDLPFADWLRPRLRNMLSVSEILQSRYDSKEHPFFGDISPDILPAWTIGYPFSLKSGKISPWHSLFNFNLASVLKIEPAKNQTSWYYMEHAGFEVWVSLKNGARWHGHADTGGIVVYYNGNPIIIDPGMMDYTPENHISASQAKASSHNTVILNENPPDIERNLVNSTELPLSTTETFEKSAESLLFRIKYAKGEETITRSIRISEAGVTVEDSAGPKAPLTAYSTNWSFCGRVTQETLKGDAPSMVLDGNFGVVWKNARVADYSVSKRSVAYGNVTTCTSVVALSVLSGEEKVILELKKK